MITCVYYGPGTYYYDVLTVTECGDEAKRHTLSRGASYHGRTFRGLDMHVVSGSLPPVVLMYVGF